jgi:pimeloyl-ACP methyl ester carboxylesterase
VKLTKKGRRRLKTLAGIGLVLTGLKVYSDAKLRRFERENPPIGRFVTVDGVRLHYIIRGSGSPVVFLHGANGLIQDFTLSILDRAAKDYQVIAFDRPGHGYSERPAKDGGSPVVQARLIHDALKKLGIEKPAIVGHSWSGSLVLAYALEYPNDLSGVVTLGGYVIPHDIKLAWVTRFTDVPVIGGLFTNTLLVPFGPAFVRMYSPPAFSPGRVPKDYIKTFTPFVLRPSQFKSNMEDLGTINPALKALYPRYGEIRVPLVIVHGDADKIVNVSHARELHEAIPHSKLIIVPKEGHEIHYSHPDVVMDAIEEVFSRSATEGN